MNEIEKIARRLVRKCVSEVDGNFWFDRTKAAAIIKEVLAAATKRAEEAEEQVKQWQKIEDELCKEVAGCRDLIATLRNRVAEGESRVKELEGAIRATGEKVRTGIHCRWVDHHNWCCDCKKISAEYDALLTEASDGE